MIFELNRDGFSYEVSTSPEGNGFMGIISKVRREEGRVVWQEEWRRLDFPRPTRRLAEADAHSLAAALLDQADADAAAANGMAIEPPHVSADEVIQSARSVPSGVIGDGLYQDLGRPLFAYYCGFERALQELPPPKEIPASAMIYWAGYRDGEAAQPMLLDVGVLSKDWGSREHWRDRPITPTFERTVLTDRDLVAGYTVDLMRIDVQPIYEPGYPAVDGESREIQPHVYYRVTARFHERPLPRRMVEAWRSNPEYDGVPDSTPTLPFGSMGLRQKNPFFQWNRYVQGMYGGVKTGVLELVSSYDRPDDDVSSALLETKHLVGSTVAVLEGYRRKNPDAFIGDPVTVTLQQRAAQLRHIAAQGPTQIPEISDERAAEMGEQGREAQRSVHAWNVQARQNYESHIADLPLLEEQLLARNADLYDAGGLRSPSETHHSPYGPRDGKPALGWEPCVSPGIPDEQLLYEITMIVEAEAPGEFSIELNQPGLIELRLRHPKPTIHDVVPRHPIIPHRLQPYDALERVLHQAARRWEVSPWAIPPRGAADTDHPTHDLRMLSTSRPTHGWTVLSTSRWVVSSQRDLTVHDGLPPDPNRNIRRVHVSIEVLLAPPGCRAPTEWEC